MRTSLKKYFVISSVLCVLFSLNGLSANEKNKSTNVDPNSIKKTTSIKPSTPSGIKVPVTALSEVPVSVPKPEPSKLKITADEATHDRKSKISIAKGHVKIVQDNVTIFTSEVNYNDNTKTSIVDDFVRIIQLDKENKRKTDISANKLIAYHQEKKIHMEDSVRFDREEERISPFDTIKKTTSAPKTEKEKIEESVRKERTVITADVVDYSTKTGDATFTGKATIIQRDKKVLGDTITIKNDENKNTDTIVLDKNAKLTQIKGDWLVREGIIKVDGEKEKERFVKEKLEMTADKITIYQKTNNINGEKNVKIVQIVSNKQREAVGDIGMYDDVAKTMTLIGNVKIKKENNDWLSAEKAIFHTDSENFEAFSQINNDIPLPPNIRKQVETEFTIPDEEQPESPLPINTPAPDINLDEGKNNKKEKKKPVSLPSAPALKVSPVVSVPPVAPIVTPSNVLPSVVTTPNPTSSISPSKGR